jgi:hypothetical protein
MLLYAEKHLFFLKERTYEDHKDIHLVLQHSGSYHSRTCMQIELCFIHFGFSFYTCHKQFDTST